MREGVQRASNSLCYSTLGHMALSTKTLRMPTLRATTSCINTRSNSSLSLDHCQTVTLRANQLFNISSPRDDNLCTFNVE